MRKAGATIEKRRAGGHGRAEEVLRQSAAAAPAAIRRDAGRTLRTAPEVRQVVASSPPTRASDTRPPRVRCATSSPIAGSRPTQTYRRENPKRVYYISIEFLIGRSLANNIMNLMLDPVVLKAFAEHACLDGDPRTGTGRGARQRWARPARRLFSRFDGDDGLPAMGYGLRYEHGIFQQNLRNGWQEEQPDNWLVQPDPWEVVRPTKSSRCTVRLPLNARRASLPWSRTSLRHSSAFPYDRPVIGYGGKTINTLRLWARRPRIISTSSGSAAAISSRRWPRRSPPNR